MPSWQVLRPLDKEQEELNREKAALVAALLVPSKPSAALSLIQLDALQSGPTLLQWRRSGRLSARLRVSFVPPEAATAFVSFRCVIC
jgi:hypothetical protein